MNNVFLVSGIISVVFFISKFIEMRFVEKENKPLKFLIRDSLLVYFSCIFGLFVIEQLTPAMKDVVDGTAELGASVPLAFTDAPNF
jgi:hypothetical protein